MANVKECDRCKEIIRGDSASVEITTIAEHKFFDLCEKCQQDFYRFVGGEDDLRRTKVINERNTIEKDRFGHCCETCGKFKPFNGFCDDKKQTIMFPGTPNICPSWVEKSVDPETLMSRSELEQKAQDYYVGHKGNSGHGS